MVDQTTLEAIKSQLDRLVEAVTLITRTQLYHSKSLETLLAAMSVPASKDDGFRDLLREVLLGLKGHHKDIGTLLREIGLLPNALAEALSAELQRLDETDEG